MSFPDPITFCNVVRSDLSSYKPAPNLLFNEKVRALISEGHNIYHFGFGQSPFPVMEKARQELCKHAAVKDYLPVFGIPELRKAICDFHKEFDGLTHPSTDNVVVGPGSKELIFLLQNVFEGDRFLLYPTWSTYTSQVQLAHQKPHFIHTEFTNGWKLTPELLEDAMKETTRENKLLVLCNPDNPTGTAYSAEELKELTRVFRKHKVIVISDEIYGRVHFEGRHQSLARYYPEGTVLSSGLSKWAGAGGWRLGYHIYPPTLKELFNAVHSSASHTYSCASAPVQYAALPYLDLSAESKTYMCHVQRIMKATADYCYRHLSEIGLRIVKPQGGFYIFPDFEVIREALHKRGINTCQEMCDAVFEEASVALIAWDTSYKGGKRLTVRLSYVNFNGDVAMRASASLGLEVKELTDSFVEQHCQLTADGIQALKKWVINQKDTM